MSRSLDKIKVNVDSIRRLSKGDYYLKFVFILSVAFSFIAGYLSAVKFYSMDSTGYDLGLYSQALFNALHGQLFYTNLLGQSYLSEHFAPILFLMIIPYAIHSSPVTLLWVQAFVIGMASVPLYFCAKEWIKIYERRGGKKTKLLEIVPMLLSTSYIFSPMVDGPLSFDFHLMTFLPMFFFSAFYFFLKKRWLAHAIFLGLIISIHSSFVFIVIFTLIAEFFVYRGNLYYESDSSSRLISRKNMKLLGLLVIISLGLFSYYYAIAYIKPVFSGLSPNSLGPASGQTGGLSDSTIGLLLALFTEPIAVLQHLIANGNLKLLFLFVGFSGTAFTALLFPEFLFSIVPYLMYGMFSSYSAYYTLGYQYSMMLIPMVYIASIGGILRIHRSTVKHNFSYFGKRKYQKFVSPLVVTFIIAGTIGGFLYSPVAPQNPLQSETNALNLWSEHSSPSSTLVFNISKTIPKSSFIITQNDVFPFFANNPNSYSTPWSTGFSLNNTGKFTYMVAYYGSVWAFSSVKGSASLYSMINKGLSSGVFGIYAEGHDVLFIKKNYSSQPLFFAPTFYNLTGKSIGVNDSVATTGGGISYDNQLFKTIGSLMMPGKYNIVVNYTSPSYSKNNTFSISVYNNNTNETVANYNLFQNASGISNGTYSSTFEFSSNVTVSNLVFVGSDLKWNGPITIKNIGIRQIAP